MIVEIMTWGLRIWQAWLVIVQIKVKSQDFIEQSEGVGLVWNGDKDPMNI